MSLSTRRTIYAIVGLAVAIASILGYITQGEADALLEVTAALLHLVAAVASAIALRYLTSGGWADIRAALYATVGVLSLAAAALGIAVPDGWADTAGQIVAALDTAVMMIAYGHVPSGPTPYAPPYAPEHVSPDL